MKRYVIEAIDESGCVLGKFAQDAGHWYVAGECAAVLAELCCPQAYAVRIAGGWFFWRLAA
jgi:hypothetical protein